MKLAFIRPHDQPLGRVRLLDELEADLGRTDYTDLRIIVAYAKLGPLAKLADALARWHAAGRTVRAIFGIDQQGTSLEALEFALGKFDEVRISHTDQFGCTFHPKIYLFLGRRGGKAYIGSNNLTVGGTEMNFEAATIVELDARADRLQLDELVDWWREAAVGSTPLTKRYLADLVVKGFVTTEKLLRLARARGRAPAAGPRLRFPKMPIKPPRALPRNLFPAGTRRGAGRARQTTVAPIAQALVLQVLPHSNGEVFLSTTALRQNPTFFGYPFTGKTTPKKVGNPTYPQRLPDPRVDIRVFDNRGAVAVTLADFGLNTVYYTRKHDVRITVPTAVIAATPAMSILVMRKSLVAGLDFEMELHPPSSPEYASLLAICNQVMSSGGGAQGRRFGWL
jgi:hypothetical protein